MKRGTVRARVDDNLKRDVVAVLDELGLSISEAIELFLRQIRLTHGIPFEIKIPNKKTLKTFQETDMRKNLVQHKNAEDMFNKLGMKKRVKTSHN